MTQKEALRAGPYVQVSGVAFVDRLIGWIVPSARVSPKSPAGGAIPERRDELAAVYGEFEELVELLCDAAQFGPTPHLEERYAVQREWWSRRFGPIAPFVSAYLRSDPADAAYGIAVAGRRTDAFEALVAAAKLADWARADDGEMVSRIVRAREALTLYGEHLRLLETVRR